MSLKDPRSNKVAKLCELKDEIGRWHVSENDFLKEDYAFLSRIFREALDNPSEWELEGDSNTVELCCQNTSETILIDTSRKTYIWSQT